MRPAAEASVPEVRSNPGSCYERGQGVAVDFEAAFRWNSLAAANGNAVAIGGLGTACLNGSGVNVDVETAEECFRFAFELGNVRAVYDLGVLHVDPGHGVHLRSDPTTDSFPRRLEIYRPCRRMITERTRVRVPSRSSTKTFTRFLPRLRSTFARQFVTPRAR